MVNWIELSTFIQQNGFNTLSVEPIVSNWKSFPIERFPINVKIRSAFVEDLPPNPVVPTISSRLVTAAERKPVPRLLIVDDDELASPVPGPAPAPGPKVATATVVSPVDLPSAAKKTTCTQRPHDPITLGIEHTEPLYMTAGQASKKQMECEEALRIEAKVAELYKSQAGRNRGWTKTNLEAMIRPRCASGGDIYELDRARKAFVWQLVIQDKATSAFLDFICVAKQIRVCVWFEEEKMVVLYPAADHNIPDTSHTPHLYHVTSRGQYRGGIRSCKDLLQFCKKMGHTLIPPHSVFHALSHLTLAELESVGKKLGMAEVTGGKTQRVAAVAAYKLEQRLAAE